MSWKASRIQLAAVALAANSDADSNGPKSKTYRKRHINAAIKEVAEVLGNTPAVARRAYIDPRVFDRYQAGVTIAPTLRRIKDPDLDDERTRGRIERAVLTLLRG